MTGGRSRRFALPALAVVPAVALFVALSVSRPSVVKANFQEPTPTPTVQEGTATPTEAPATETPTETPAPPTETPVAATETPAAATETPMSAGGAPGAGIQPPRTGSGGSAEGNGTLSWVAGSAAVGALLLAGGVRVVLKRR